MNIAQINIKRLRHVIRKTTVLLRPGNRLSGSVVHCDLILATVAVDQAAAVVYRNELVDLLANYPEPERLAAGPSYIEVGGLLGDQGAAFGLFALGQTLGLWSIITPATFGFSGDEAKQMAGLGMVMITGYGIIKSQKEGNKIPTTTDEHQDAD